MPLTSGCSAWLRLNVIIPLLLLFAASVMALIFYDYHAKVTATAIEQNEVKRVKQLMTRLQAQIRSEFGRSDASRERLQHLIASFGSERDLLHLGIVNPKGRMAYALEKSQVGETAESLCPCYSRSDAEKVLFAGHGQVRYDASRAAIMAYFPVRIPSDQYGFEQFDRGVLFWHSDIRRLKALSRMQLGESVLWSVLLPMGAVVLFSWAVLYVMVARRATALARVAESVARGKFDIRNNFRGSDELACVGKSLDVMAGKLEETWKSLRESETRFHMIFNEAADGIVLVYPETGELSEFNGHAYRMLGYSEAEFKTKHLADFDTIESADEIRRHMQRIMSGETDNFETMMRTKSGALLRIYVSARRVTIGQRDYILSIWRDMTEYRTVEENLKKTLLSTVEAIARVSEKRNPFSIGHQQRVAELAVAIARELDLEERQIEGIRLASLILDIGEISIPAEVLNRPARIKPIEFELIKSHCMAGYDVVSGVEMPWPVATVLLQHHERLDGSGYPQGLRGDAIAVEARIVAVADVVSAMMSHRPHRRAHPIETVIDELDGKSGILYDEEVVQCCFKVIQSGRIGWLLKSGA